MIGVSQPKERSIASRREASELGVTGEQMAARYLEDEGYVILERNYRCGKHEADIIALDGKTLVIIEVKTRTNTFFGNPEDAVDHRKRGYIIRVANQYVLSHARKEDVRFDIISIVTGSQEKQITHLKDAYNVMSF